MQGARGEIYNRQRAAQIRNFSGLRFGSITPTDVDGLLDFGNKLFVLVEAKREGQELPRGQRLALERICDNLQDAGKKSAVLVVSHDTDPDQDIDFATCQLVECRYKKQWHAARKPPATCRSTIEWLLKESGLRY